MIRTDKLVEEDRGRALHAVGVNSMSSPVPVGEWNSVLATDPGATALQNPDYMAAVLEATGGLDASRLYQLSDGRLLVLPLVQQTVAPGVRVAADYPGGFGHGSLLATGGLRREDVAAVVADLRGRGLSTRIGGGHHTAEAWSAGLMPGVIEIPPRVDVVDLPDSGQVYVSRTVRRGARQSVAKAARSGVEIERDTTGRLVPAFYDLYRSWIERWVPRSGLPPALARHSALKQEPYTKFETVAERMAEKCRVFIAWHQGRAVASCITFVYGQHGIGWRSYSIKELAGPIGANTAVQVEGVRDAIESGCRYFDFGQSGGEPTLQSYKNSLGASPRRVVDLRIEPPALTRARIAADRAKGAAVNLLARLGRDG